MKKIEKGNQIKLYGRVTTVLGFDVVWNESLEDYEIILSTIGRKDPLKRSLEYIELI